MHDTEYVSVRYHKRVHIRLEDCMLLRNSVRCTALYSGHSRYSVIPYVPFAPRLCHAREHKKRGRRLPPPRALACCCCCSSETTMTRTLRVSALAVLLAVPAASVSALVIERCDAGPRRQPRSCALRLLGGVVANARLHRNGALDTQPRVRPAPARVRLLLLLLPGSRQDSQPWLTRDALLTPFSPQIRRVHQPDATGSRRLALPRARARYCLDTLTALL